MSHPVLLSVPLFVFLGLLIEMTGMAAVIVTFLSNLLGHVRGGLSYVLIVAMYLVSGISGSKAADMAAIAPALFPEMVKRGVPRGELVALLAATGAQTETIPPSLILITIGSVTGISIAALFAGGLAPGIAGGLFLAGVVWLRARRGDSVVAARMPARKSSCAAWSSPLPALALPFVIRGAIVEGVATATEVSTIGIVYACDRRPADLSPLRVAAAVADAGADCDVVGRHPADRRRRDGDGLGDHAVRHFARAGAVDRRICRGVRRRSWRCRR